MNPLSAENAPFLLRWACFGFLGGVLIHALSPFDVLPSWIPVGLCTTSVVLLSLNSPKLQCTRERRGTLLTSVFIACALGIWRFDATIPAQDTVLRLGENVTIIGSITNARTYDDVITATHVDDVPLGKGVPISFTAKGSYPGIGERWRVSCRMDSYEASQEKTRLLNARQGVFYRCKGSVSAVKIQSASWWNLAVPLAAWRTLLTKRIMTLLPGDPGALLAGILYGDRGLSKDAAASFRFAGMTHIIAVSGSNITIVVSVLVPALIALGLRRQSAILYSGAGILLFVLFTGAGSSIVRAAIMGWLALLARVFGRRPNAGHLLLLAAAMIVFFDPRALSYDMGFALSFLATWGLLVFSKPIAYLMRGIPDFIGLREVFATTTAATLATAPYMMWQFQYVSLAGLITNLFALPLVSMTMAWGAIAIACGGWFHPIVLPAEGCLRFMLWVADYSLRFPFLQVTFPVPLALMGILYAGLLWIAHQSQRMDLNKNQRRSRHSVTTSLQ